jgi:hypothetical protein
MKRALDMFTLNEIKKGQDVWIHQEDCSRKAKVVDVFLDNPTLSQEGFWVDVDDGSGVEGIMSYIIEVIT